MIYLIKSSAFRKNEKGEEEFFFLLKIGYTEDSGSERRFSQYKLHNPTCQVIYEIPNGTEDQEKKLHYKFKDLLYEGYGNEWFKYDQEIIDYIKNISLKELDKLPKNPRRGNKRILLGKRETKKIISYLFDTKEEIKDYLENLLRILGDTISYKTSLEYIKKDPSINKEKLSKYLEITKIKNFGTYCEDEIINKEISSFFKDFDNITDARLRLKFFCEYGLSQDAVKIVLGQIPDSDYIKSYYIALGPDRLKALGYKRNNIEKELGIVVFSKERLIVEIYSNFHVGERYTLANLKTKLGMIYSSINYDATPKANDIEDWFEVKEVSVYEKKPEGGRRRIRVYELVGPKK